MKDKLIKIDNFPCYMLCYCEYGSKEGIENEDIKNYNHWRKEHKLNYAYCETEDNISYVTSPVFGKSCSVTTAYFRAWPETKVVFRKEKDNNIIAVFPEHNEKNYCKECYASKEGHSTISQEYYLRDTTRASEEEYKELKRELEVFYEYNLVVRQRCNW